MCESININSIVIINFSCILSGTAETKILPSVVFIYLFRPKWSRSLNDQTSVYTLFASPVRFHGLRGFTAKTSSPLVFIMVVVRNEGYLKYFNKSKICFAATVQIYIYG